MMEISQYFIFHVQYENEDAIAKDFEILFANARHFNEEGSQIYEDAVVLEKLMKKKKRAVVTAMTGKDLMVIKDLKIFS